MKRLLFALAVLCVASVAEAQWYSGTSTRIGNQTFYNGYVYGQPQFVAPQVRVRVTPDYSNFFLQQYMWNQVYSDPYSSLPYRSPIRVYGLDGRLQRVIP